jgi:nucleoside 2-deoxyribosyltransferase
VKIYLAGPMRGYSEFNHPAFRKAASMLRDSGHEVFCPAEKDAEAGFDAAGATGDLAELALAGVSLRDLLGADLAWICGTADALVMLPGWVQSAGARAEAATALALSLPVWEFAWFTLYGEEAIRVMTVPGVQA